MTDRDIARFVSVYQRYNPDRLCLIDGNKREIYSRRRDFDVTKK